MNDEYIQVKIITLIFASLYSVGYKRVEGNAYTQMV